MKKYLLGLFAVVLAVGFSAFTKQEVKERPTATVYFRYLPSSAFGETDFETLTNWTTASNPTDINCPGATDPCIVAINDANIPRHTGNSLLQDYVILLQNISSGNQYTGFNGTYSTPQAFAYGEMTDRKN